MANEVMEFRLINPTEGNFLRKIDWNKEELEAAVRAKMSVYQNVVYTEDTIQDAKKDRAELNNLKKAIESRRIEVKKILNEPYEQFEKEVKEIVALIEEPAALIDKQVKDFEDHQKEEKRKQLVAVYDAVIEGLKDVLPFEKVFDPRYLNKTYKFEDAKSEIEERIKRVKTDLESIDSLDSKYKLNAKDVYIKTMDLSKAMAENKRLLDLEEKLEAEKKRKEAEEAERRKREEERKKAEEARIAEENARKAEENARIEAENARRAEEEAQREAERQKALAEADEKLTGVAERNAIPEEQKETPKQYRIRFEAVGTREQLEKLVAYMDENGIERNKI